jgi:ankyrin repeat protein
MDKFAGLLRAIVAGGILASILSGCGTMGFGPTSLDPVRLNNAIATDDVHYVRGAVESKVVSVNQLIPASGYMEGTPLITIAARAGAVDVLRYLIAAGANVNSLTPAGETSLMLAAYFGGDDGAPSPRHEAAMHMLVKAGASLESEWYSYTPLSYAAYKGRLRTIRFLLDLGARVDTDVDSGMSYVPTPLMMAAMMGHADCVVTLLNAGADARIRVKGGLTARELALKYRHERLARMLACAESLAPGDRAVGRCL